MSNIKKIYYEISFGMRAWAWQKYNCANDTSVITREAFVISMQPMNDENSNG